MSLLKSRPAGMEDSELLRAWRNDERTRAMSLDSREIPETEHALWLSAILRDNSKRLCLVYQRGSSGGRVHVGTYRLDGVGSSAVEISLTVAPEWRGTGLATPIIQLAVEHAAIAQAQHVLAVVRNENVASQRAFERAGFKVDCEVGGLRYYGRKISVEAALV